MTPTPPTLCANPKCRLPLHSTLEKPETEHHASGRTETPIGPMHPRCFVRFQREALDRAYNLVKIERGE